MMKEIPDQLLENATREELFACVQLLAVSVVQHRAHCGFVAFNNTVDQLRSSSDSADDTGLFVQGTEVLEEALEMVRVLAAEPASSPVEETESSDTLAEKRNQLRISVKAPIKVLWPGDSDPVNAKLENISWGGAAIHIDHTKTEAGDSLRIILPGTKGDSISIEAKVLRTWDLPEGKGMATRFSSLSTRDETELENVLEFLAQSADSDGQRKYARLTQRLDIQFDGDQELHATLDDISTGGLGITVPDPLQIGQSLQAVISALDESCSLKLRARVVRQVPIAIGRAEFYQVGLKFEHPSEELNQLTNELIRKMSSMKVTTSSANDPSHSFP